MCRFAHATVTGAALTFDRNSVGLIGTAQTSLALGSIATHQYGSAAERLSGAPRRDRLDDYGSAHRPQRHSAHDARRGRGAQADRAVAKNAVRRGAHEPAPARAANLRTGRIWRQR